MNDDAMNTKPHIVSGFMEWETGGWYFIAHPDKPSWFLTNRAGRRILAHLDRENRLTDTAGNKESDNICMDDLKSFVSLISRHGMLDEDMPCSGCHNTCFSSTFLHITGKCNLSCRHCYYPVESSRLGSEVSDEEFMAYLVSFYEQGGRAVTLSGGEPFMRMGLVSRVVEMKNWDSVQILTNGTMIDEDVIRLLKCFPHVSLQISLDGGTSSVHDRIRGDGCFNRVLNGIEMLCEEAVSDRITICCTITDQDSEDLMPLIPLCRSYGVRSLRFIPVRRKGRMAQSNDIDWRRFKDLTDELLKVPGSTGVSITTGAGGFSLSEKDFHNNKHWCSVGRNLVVDSTGDVYPCVLLMEPEFRAGNIRTDPFSCFSESRVFSELLKVLRLRTFNIAKCRQCVWKNFCQAGCMGIAYERFGSIYVDDGACMSRRKRYEGAVKKLIESW